MSILCLLSGCKKSSRAPIWQNHSPLGQTQQRDGKLCEARLVDIPVPLETELKEHVSLQETDISCSFITADTFDHMHDFYIQHMELEGWRLVREFLGSVEYLLVFEKPQKICCISIRSVQTHPQKTYVSLWTGPKN